MFTSLTQKVVPITRRFCGWEVGRVGDFFFYFFFLREVLRYEKV